MYISAYYPGTNLCFTTAGKTMAIRIATPRADGKKPSIDYRCENRKNVELTG
jgi:hypothetical protein